MGEPSMAALSHPQVFGPVLRRSEVSRGPIEDAHPMRHLALAREEYAHECPHLASAREARVGPQPILFLYGY